MKPQGKIVAFIVGAVATALIFILVMIVASKPDPAFEETDSDRVVGSSDLLEVKNKTSTLRNYGDLPEVLVKDDIGRENPFEAY